MRKFTKYPQSYVHANSSAEVPMEVQDALGRDVDRLRRKDLFKGRVPKNIQDRTLENMDVYHMSLSDSFDEACRTLAPKGSELHDAWYYSDFRKFIPSAYDEQYLDFKKYPLKYKQAKKAGDVTASQKIVAYDTSDDELTIDDMIDYIYTEWENCGCGEIMSRDEAEEYLGHSVSDMTQDEIDEEVSEIQKEYYTSGEASEDEIIDMYNEMRGIIE